MPSYSFKERFVPFVKNFTKRQTIRGIRKHPAKPGDTISHFTGSRFKPVRIIDKQICIGVDTIFILENGEVYIAKDVVMNEISAKFSLDRPIVLNGFKKLTIGERNEFAFDDGFRRASFVTNDCFSEMISFWKDTHALPFAGHIIKW